ncbi:MAG: hypothetical protein AAF533_22205 [Acidobacteriota bacterium]
MIGIYVTAAWLSRSNPTVLAELGQEDGGVEWASAWAFLLAAFVYCGRALRLTEGRILAALLALGALLIALEELSWGQRLVGYRPPELFLESNFQQELNVHNLVAKAWRMRAFLAVVLGYGVGLRLLTVLAPAQARRFGVLAPPWALAPAFLVTALIFNARPWHLSGEWAELGLGIGMLAGALLIEPSWPRLPPRFLAFTAPAAVVLCGLLGFGTAWLTARRASSPALVAQAQLECYALSDDLRRVPFRSPRHHRRAYHAVADRGPQLELTSFRSLIGPALPEERAQYLLDPWNSPYWVLVECPEGGGPCRQVVYSMGPNRRREGRPGDFQGDDIGVDLEL